MYDPIYEKPKKYKSDFPRITIILGLMGLSCSLCSIDQIFEQGSLTIGAIGVFLIAFGLFISKLTIVVISAILSRLSRIGDKVDSQEKPKRHIRKTALEASQRFSCSLTCAMAAAIPAVVWLLLMVVAYQGIQSIEPVQNPDGMEALDNVFIILLVGVILVLIPPFFIFSTISGVFFVRFRQLKEKLSCVAIIIGILLGTGFLALVVFLLWLLVKSISQT